MELKDTRYCKTKREAQSSPNNLLQFRQQDNISQDKLAEVVDCSRRTIGYIERGVHDPSVQMAYRIANFHWWSQTHSAPGSVHTAVLVTLNFDDMEKLLSAVDYSMVIGKGYQGSRVMRILECENYSQYIVIIPHYIKSKLIFRRKKSSFRGRIS